MVVRLSALQTGRSRKLRFPDFMTMAQDGGKVVSLTDWPFQEVKVPRFHDNGIGWW